MEQLLPGSTNTNSLQLFSSEASAQSMIWLHCADFPTQTPSAQRNSAGAHADSGTYGYKHVNLAAKQALQMHIRHMMMF